MRARLVPERRPPPAVALVRTASFPSTPRPRQRQEQCRALWLASLWLSPAPRPARHRLHPHCYPSLVPPLLCRTSCVCSFFLSNHRKPLSTQMPGYTPFPLCVLVQIWMERQCWAWRAGWITRWCWRAAGTSVGAAPARNSVAGARCLRRLARRAPRAHQPTAGAHCPALLPAFPLWMLAGLPPLTLIWMLQEGRRGIRDDKNGGGEGAVGIKGSPGGGCSHAPAAGSGQRATGSAQTPKTPRSRADGQALLRCCACRQGWDQGWLQQPTRRQSAVENSATQQERQGRNSWCMQGEAEGRCTW